jgi:osmoprotectant transport system ATP-binding protein
LIQLREVSKVFHDPARGEIVAVDRVSFSVDAGETLCLIGTSGCGKTTTMKLVNRLIEPSGGEILVDGEDVRSVDEIALRRRIGYVIQSGGLFPHMSVGRNVGLLCELEGWSRRRRDARVAALLELVNLPPDEFAHRYPADLSGGQRQRVGVARALALDPDYVLMDEPFGALDPITRDQIQQEFERLESIVRKTVILVTHDLREALRLGDRIALMDAGRIVQIGTEAELRDAPAEPFVTEFMTSHLDGGDLEGGRP